MRILDIFAKGYAGATMGGTSFMVNIEVEKGRFPELEENGNDGYMLNVLLPEPHYGNELRFSLATKLINKENGDISLWGEEEKFNEEEISMIKKWCEDNKIEEEATSIKQEIKEVDEKMDEIYEKKMELYKQKWTTPEKYEEKYNQLEALDKEYKQLNKRYKELHGE